MLARLHIYSSSVLKLICSMYEYITLINLKCHPLAMQVIKDYTLCMSQTHQTCTNAFQQCAK